MIRIIIADDVGVIRNGLKNLLDTEEEIEVCGLAENGLQAFEMCKEKKPDLVLMDMSMPVMNGSEATKKIKSEFPEIKVLVLTTFDDRDTVTEALLSGADGYLLKNIDDERIITSIKSTMNGVSSIGSEVFDRIKSQYIKQKEISSLTTREKELISHIANGKTNKAIATELHLSEGTVRNYVSSLFEKLDVEDRTQIAVYAAKNDLI